MSAPGKLVRSSRWKTGPSKGQRPLGSECCVATGDSGREAYTAIAWGVGLSHERSDIAGAEGFHSLEGNMCGTVLRGAHALPGSKATTSRAKGSHRNLGDLASGRRCHGLCAEYGGPHREGEEPKLHGHSKIQQSPEKQRHCGFRVTYRVTFPARRRPPMRYFRTSGYRRDRRTAPVGLRPRHGRVLLFRI
jgi:hypothetical protein